MLISIYGWLKSKCISTKVYLPSKLTDRKRTKLKHQGACPWGSLPLKLQVCSSNSSSLCSTQWLFNPLQMAKRYNWHWYCRGKCPRMVLQIQHLPRTIFCYCIIHCLCISWNILSVGLLWNLLLMQLQIFPLPTKLSFHA